MKAVVFDGTLSLRDVEKPCRKDGEALIAVSWAGICNTDHEIIEGYVPGFRGILGHEFVGTVLEADDEALVGKRVAGEINISCGSCDMCRAGLRRHCLSRAVLGIRDRNGAFAQFLALPAENLVLIPDDIPDERAIFLEPFAAALEIREQVKIGLEQKVLLIGDGKLGLLIAMALKPTGCSLTVLGRHSAKLRLLEGWGIETVTTLDCAMVSFDVVVEASGNESGFRLGLQYVRPRGTLVLKSTYALPFLFNPAPVVVNEITVVGSRCGKIGDAVEFLKNVKPPVEKLVSGRFRLDEALQAFRFSGRPEVVKVLFAVNPSEARLTDAVPSSG